MKPTYKPTVIIIAALAVALCTVAKALCQIEWTKYEGNPVMVSDTSSWEKEGVAASSIIFDGNTYKMWYWGAVSIRERIGYATSFDGISWDKCPSNPVITIGASGSWESKLVLGPSVIFDGTLYHMWYNGGSANPTTCIIGYATSLDGISWEKYEGNPVLTTGPSGSWDSLWLWCPKVVLVDSVFHMWYGASEAGVNWRIGYAISHDGKEWTKHPDNPVMELGEPGSWDQQHQVPFYIQMKGSTFRMFYHAIGGSPQAMRIGIAESEDGVHWTKYEGNPILDIGSPGTWDEAHVEGLILTFDGSTYSMWYTGNAGRFIQSRIGLATSTPNKHDIKVMSTPAHLSSVPILINEGITPQVKINNIGLTDEFNVPVTCIIDSAGLVVYSNTKTIDTLMSQDMKFTEVKFDSWGGKCTSEYVFNVCYFTQLSDYENTSNDTLKKTIEFCNLIDDFESGLYNWYSETGWGITNASAQSGTSSLSNSPQGSYGNNLDCWVEFNYSFDLSHLEAAHISLWTRHLIEKDRDFGYLEVSTDNGDTWQQVGEVFTGIQAQWTETGRSLTDYCKPEFNDVRIRFHFLSDSTQPYPMFGWFIDDVAIYPYELQTTVSQSIGKLLPQKYALFDNYPNPFNSQTFIEYQVPEAGHVRVSIYNLLGQRIITLVDKKHQTGRFNLIWDGKDYLGKSVPSGVYFCKMEAEGFAETKKMLLLE